MNTALLLIDFQADFLAAENLQPAAGEVVERAAELLAVARQQRLPIVHIVTTVTREPDNRMPHWRAANQWRCELNTPGHQEAEALRPIAGEHVIHKQFFSGFGSDQLQPLLKSLRVDTLILAGVHVHGCVRATAMDAYQNGYRVLIADDAMASDDPLHAAITRRYLARRMADFLPVSRLREMFSGLRGGLGAAGSGVEAAARGASAAAQVWRETSLPERIVPLLRWAELLLENVEPLAKLITTLVGKPITQARGEVHRSAALIRAVVKNAPPSLEVQTSAQARFRYQPLGVVGIITPWNNPVAIPIGKIAPAILFGNAVVWKPAPAAQGLSMPLLELAQRAGLQQHGHSLIHLVEGDHGVAAALAEDARVEAISLSGSLRAGYALQEICARRAIPFQGELGGNNAAIVWKDANLGDAARLIAEGAFGFAGQRCTANRRAIVPSSLMDTFLDLLVEATGALPLGNPEDPRTVIGPVIHAGKQREIEQLVERAKRSGLRTLVPHSGLPGADRPYVRPTIVVAPDPAHEIVQEETFGPVLVVQPASSFDEALRLLNGVRQGLIAALFSRDESLRAQFLTHAQAGVLKFNRATADADAVSPLGGWKTSGVGPPEHGPSDREFFTRTQTLYAAPE